MIIVRRCTAGDNVVEQEGRRTTMPTHCDCRSFEFNGSCDHVNRLRERTCTWREDDSPIPLGPDPSKCPVCGAPTGVSLAKRP